MSNTWNAAGGRRARGAGRGYPTPCSLLPALCALGLLLLALPLSANVTTSAITGRVTIGEAPAAGVTVTASSSVLQQPRTTVTGPRGTYWLGALPPGEYDVAFSLAGHTTLIRRAVVELARVGRADAALEKNEDEETVTSTATTVSVSDTTAITTHFDDQTLDRLPLGRQGNVQVAPDQFFPAYEEVDGGPPFFAPLFLAEDLIEQTTVVRGTAPVEYETYSGNVAPVLTRRGGEDFFFSLRDTITNAAWIERNPGFPQFTQDAGLRHFVEATGGGRILPRRLWFFAAAWTGDRAMTLPGDVTGFNGKLHAQLGSANHLDGSYLQSRVHSRFLDFGSSTAWLQHTLVAGPHLTWETRTTRVWSDQFPFGAPADVPMVHVNLVNSRGSYVVPARTGDHVLTAGAFLSTGDFPSTTAFFANDRWSSSRWVVDAGVRHEDTRGERALMPRIAGTYDLRGDGTRAIAASYGDYSSARLHVATLGYATAIGRSGTARVDVLHRSLNGEDITSLQLDTRYRLFDRFEAGATYTYERSFGDGHAANAWIGAQLPVGSHEFGVTVLQRYRTFDNPPVYTSSVAPTDVALRYSIPFSRLGLMVAADVVNVFASGDAGGPIPRALRFWLRARV